jgi:hypothetical protein
MSRLGGRVLTSGSRLMIVDWFEALIGEAMSVWGRQRCEVVIMQCLK